MTNANISPQNSPESSKGSMDWVRKHKNAVTGFSSVALALALTSCGEQGSNETAPEPNPVSTSEVTHVPEVEQDIPAEAQAYVAEFGNRYNLPVATYYAEVAYEANNNDMPATINDDFITYYESENSKDGTESMLGGMEYLFLPLDTEIVNENVDVAVNFFNDDKVLSCMNRFMNLAAKNPGHEALSVIEDQFNHYCGYRAAEVGAASDFQKLKNTLLSVVQQYGSNANYSVGPATTDRTNVEGTLFGAYGGDTGIDNVDDEGNVLSFSTMIDFKINVDVYNDAGEVTRTQEVFESAQFSISRVPPAGPTDPGRVVFGLK